MPVIYETTATITDNGHLALDIQNLPFENGTQFLVKLIPQMSYPPETFKKRMQSFIEECAQHNPYTNMSKSQILTALRRQREEMYDETASCES